MEDLKQQAFFYEKDFAENEVVLIDKDIYSLTIAANLTKACSPTQLLYCIRQCTAVFSIQLFIAVLYMYEFKSLDRFQPFYNFFTAIRMITVWLM